MIPLSGGFPNPQMFPFKQLTLEVSGGDQIVLQGKGLQVKNISIPPTSQTQAALQYKKTRQPCNTSPPRATLACFTNCVNCRKKPTYLTR